ncbi:winged helix-turn-helix domain-containing protein/riboflavin kinase [Methanolobus bombayensis]|uniref:winged helix-turn-helix domain-containing protein/riboflavin kinase n=1 Tax=Methanolobus bombayensis TaxID=38023 RepID=UPI001AE11A95|nr:winged helix-turn-helix domain-containing protein/riboflavin kinase [Methanolobus bombayensis]MBP1907844.1 riboflavin kinase [Methanolobus bombayensis]
MYTTTSLKELALLGAIEKPVKISSTEFMHHISASSKTAARVLKQLEDDGYISRQLVAGGQMVHLTEVGVDLLKKEYADYQQIFCKDHPDLDLYGVVITGLGEGQYYIAKDGYMSQFRDKLDFKPFPGTLNVRLNDESAQLRDNMDFMEPLTIHGFNDGERSFGGGKCYPVEIEGIKSAVIIPDRTHYPADLLEIIAPLKLRETLKLNDGDEVKIVVKNPQKCN